VDLETEIGTTTCTTFHRAENIVEETERRKQSQQNDEMFWGCNVSKDKKNTTGDAINLDFNAFNHPGR